MPNYSSSEFVTVHKVLYTDTSPLTLYSAIAGDVIRSIHVRVVTTWNDGSKSFIVGDDDNDDGFMEDADIDLESTGLNGVESRYRGVYMWAVAGSSPIDKFYLASKTINATFVGQGNGGSQGECWVYFLYCRAPQPPA